MPKLFLKQIFISFSPFFFPALSLSPRVLQVELWMGGGGGARRGGWSRRRSSQGLPPPSSQQKVWFGCTNQKLAWTSILLGSHLIGRVNRHVMSQPLR